MRHYHHYKIQILKLFLFFGIILIIYLTIGILTKEHIILQKDECRVLQIFDGDTIEVDCNGRVDKVRFIGIDTPETHKPDTPVQCFGPEASNFTTSLLKNRIIKLEKDFEDKDIYGRLLRYVYLDNVMINEIIAKNGYSYLLTIPPDVKYTDKFKSAVNYAREHELGLWKSCKGIDGRVR